uniref:polynucleotide adenylyltransferase n=1 Tax=Plectus sambesii TaxID=2011161 RepID=A0A914V6T7_9BILA
MDRNIWCQPEQRGPALDTWNTVFATATKALEASRHDGAPTVSLMNGVASSSASSTCSKMSEQSDDDAGVMSPSTTPSLVNGHDQQEAKAADFDGFIPLCSPPANSSTSTDGDSDSVTNRSWRGARPDSRSPLVNNGLHPNNNFLMRNRARTLPHDGSLSELCRRHGGTPWIIPSDKTYPISMIGLHEEIIDFYNWIKPSPVEGRLRQQVFYRLSSVIHDLWPGARVDFFGSFRTGLFLPTSDIDVVVYGSWETLPHWTLAKALVREGFADEACIKVLDKAAVPIVKLVDKDTDIRLDISFNVSYGIQAANLIIEFIQLYPALKYLVFTLKQFLLQRDLNEVFTGGVGSYSLILMVISFLQLHPTRDLRHVQIHNLNLGVLLIEFLELYGREFNYLKTALRIKHGGAYVSKDEIQQQMEGGHRPSMLCIEDPLQPGNDIGRGSHGAIHVKRAFEHALYFLLPVLFHGGSQNIFSERGSVLARVIRVTDEVIDYRERLRGGVLQQAASPGGYENSHASGPPSTALISPPAVSLTEPHHHSVPSSTADSRRASSDSTSASLLSAATTDTSRTKPTSEVSMGAKKESPTTRGRGSNEPLPMGRQGGGRGGYRGGNAQGGGQSQRYNGGGSFRNSTPRKKARGGPQEHRGGGGGNGGAQRTRPQRDSTATTAAGGGDSYHHYPHVRTVYRSTKGGPRGRGGGASHSSTSTSQHHP